MAASTSTAADSNNNSCYDVFISHRGPDVKKTFASHLYRRLISYGLRVFLDYQELREGEDLTCQIKGAIRTASLHIAIFSPTYADSQWCLDELVLMLESTAPTIPVFHHVKPTELRRTHGEGAYARSLRNLERKRKYDSDQPRYGSETIEKWRNALSRVADISGLDLDAFNGDEGELLDKVVDAVFKKGVKTQLNVARHPTGLQEKVEDFETNVLSQQQSGKVQVVGITGCGGVGKTTLAKELFNRKNSNYTKSYFLLDIRENAKISLHSLQSKLLKGLLQLDKLEIDNKDQGIEMLRKHLSSSQVLLVLDDVDDVEQVHALLTLDVLRHDSLILITSRDKSVLARSGVQESSIYKLTGLDTERSRELFCRHAFCQPHPLSGFEDLVNQFLRASDGLPLSLKVFGGLLYGNTDKSYWEDELDQLRKTLPSEIQKRLQISYDALQTEEKQIFLDIACFFIGESRDSAIRVWDGSGWKGSRGFQSLLNKCLVEVDINLDTMEHYIRMHDHLRDMGRDLANSSGLPCRLWRGTKEHIEDLLQQSSEATKVRGIRVYSDEDDERASFSRYKMKNLQLLDIDIEEEDPLKCLLEGVDSPKLLWLRWRNCPCSSLPPYIPMEKLRVIEVDGYTLETLWQEDSQAPLQLRELWIDCNLSKIPKSIGQLKHLERMEVTSWSHSMIEIPKEFCDLCSLKHLRLFIHNMSSLPDSFGNLSTLQHIDLSVCRRLERLPDSFGNLSRLQHINLSSCSRLERLPDSFGNLSRLQHINLSRCSRLERLPNSFRNLIKLKYLHLSGCNKLIIPGGTFLKITLEDMTLPKWRMDPQVVHQSYVEKLVLGLINLIEWPSATGESSHVEKLVLETPFLEKLSPSFGRDPRNLKYLELRRCRGLKRLPDSFLLLNQLIELTVEDSWLPELHLKAGEGESKTLTDSGGQRTLEISFPTGVCRGLQHLEIRECRDLVEVGTLPDALIILQFTDCPKLKKIERLCGFTKIQMLDGSLCKEVEELPLMEDKSEALTEWRGQRALRDLDSSFGKYLLRLQQLELHSTSISELSFPTGVCPNLQRLDIRECRDLVEVGTLPDALINLQFTGCPKLRQIERLCGFPKLQTLDGSLCKEMEELPLMEDKSGASTEWRGQRALSDLDSSFDKYLLSLQHLELHSTAILEVSFPTGVCPNLQRLDIRECRDLVEVGTLPDALINLQLIVCPKLREIERLCSFPKFQTLEVSLCKEEKSGTLTESRGNRALGNLDFSFDKYLLRLQHLELHDIAISDVSFPTGVCPNLQHLDIKECRDLVDVGTLPDALTSLQLTGCPELKKIERLFRFTELQTPYRRGQRTFSNFDPLFDKSMLSLQHLEPCNTEISEVSFPKGVHPNLQYLSIKHGNSTVEFGKSPNGEFMKLEVLNCCKLRRIEELCGLAKLQILDISSCEGVELSSMETLVSLEKLQVLGCPNLRSIHGLAHLTHLRELNVSGCSELEELPGLDHLTSLETLLAGECVKLESIQGLARLTQLRELSVSGCVKLESIQGLARLTQLQELSISGCVKLESTQGLARLTQLRELSVSGCSELQELPGLEHLTSLKKLSANKCVNLKNIKGLEQLTQLRELSISGCSKLQDLPGLDHLTSLEMLLAGECAKLESIQGLARLTQLRELSVSGCSQLQELPGLEHLTSLKKLSADKCVKLKNTKGLEQLTQLLEVDVSGCFELEEMPGVVCLQPLVELRL